jgi:hypothetical protein
LVFGFLYPFFTLAWFGTKSPNGRLFQFAGGPKAFIFY